MAADMSIRGTCFRRALPLLDGNRDLPAHAREVFDSLRGCGSKKNVWLWG